jgi:hypothetical protein
MRRPVAAFIQRSESGSTMNGYLSWHDLVLRLLIVIAGCIAAAIFILRGDGAALPALAVGGVIGAIAVRWAAAGTEAEE